MQKGIIMFGLFIGSFLGGYLPVIWGGSVFSFTSVLMGAVGGFLGIWGAWKLTQSF